MMGNLTKSPAYFLVSMPPKTTEPLELSNPPNSKLKARLWVMPCAKRLSIKNG